MIVHRPRTTPYTGSGGGGSVESYPWSSWRSASSEVKFDRRRRHASRGSRGSMGGHAPEVPQSLQHCGPATAGLQQQQVEGQAVLARTLQIHEEPGEHHEAVEPHQAWVHDQHRGQQTYRCVFLCTIIDGLIKSLEIRWRIIIKWLYWGEKIMTHRVYGRVSNC